MDNQETAECKFCRSMMTATENPACEHLKTETPRGKSQGQATHLAESCCMCLPCSTRGRKDDTTFRSGCRGQWTVRNRRNFNLGTDHFNLASSWCQESWGLDAFTFPALRLNLKDKNDWNNAFPESQIIIYQQVQEIISTNQLLTTTNNPTILQWNRKSEKSYNT